MTSAPIEVADWLDGQDLQPPDDRHAGPAVAPTPSRWSSGALTSQGFKIKDATAHRLPGLVDGPDRVARRGDGHRLGLQADPARRDRRPPSGAGTTLTIAVEKGGEHRAGRRKGREALTAAFQDAQRRGVPVTTTPWEKP